MEEKEFINLALLLSSCLPCLLWNMLSQIPACKQGEISQGSVSQGTEKGDDQVSKGVGRKKNNKSGENSIQCLILIFAFLLLFSAEFI